MFKKIFSFFSSSHAQVNNNQSLHVKNLKDNGYCRREFVQPSIYSLQGFTEEEKNIIIEKILTANQSSIFETREELFTKYFKNKDWEWPELTYWNRIISEKKCHFLLDKWWLSIRFQVKQLTPENIFEMTDTRHIRRYLDDCHITFENPKRDVKKFFQNFFHANPDYLDKINKLFQEEMRVKKNHAKLFLLFSTLIDRSQFKEKIEKGKKLGITYSVKTAGDSNENFEKSKKLAFVDAPPYFPGMLLWLEAHVPDFDSSPTK